MKNEVKLCDWRSTRWWLNRKDRTDLRPETLQLYELDLFDKREVDRRGLCRVGRHTEPGTEHGAVGGGVMMRMLRRMGRQLRIGDRVQQDEPSSQDANRQLLHHRLHRIVIGRTQPSPALASEFLR